MFITAAQFQNLAATGEDLMLDYDQSCETYICIRLERSTVQGKSIGHLHQRYERYMNDAGQIFMYDPDTDEYVPKGDLEPELIEFRPGHWACY